VLDQAQVYGLRGVRYPRRIIRALKRSRRPRAPVTEVEPRAPASTPWRLGPDSQFKGILTPNGDDVMA